MSSLAPLDSQELIVVTGKGGVGKSAIAAALGRRFAAAGRRALVLEIDPRENVHQMLGVSPSGGEIVAVAPRLYLQHLEPRSVLDQIVRERVRIELLVRRVLNSPVYHHFTEGAPGLKEMAVLGHSLILVEGRVPGAPQIDVVVLDAPATGHGLALLAAPLLVSEVIRHGPIATMASEVARLVASAKRCGVVVVTQAEEMPVTEALEFVTLLQSRLQRQPELILANGLYPAVDQGVQRRIEDPVTCLWMDRRRLNEYQLERLAADWQGPIGEIPLLPLDRGPALTAALEERLEQL